MNKICIEIKCFTIFTLELKNRSLDMRLCGVFQRCEICVGCFVYRVMYI